MHVNGFNLLTAAIMLLLSSGTTVQTSWEAFYQAAIAAVARRPQIPHQQPEQTRQLYQAMQVALARCRKAR